jgi:hypothetical protein
VRRGAQPTELRIQHGQIPLFLDRPDLIDPKGLGLSLKGPHHLLNAHVNSVPLSRQRDETVSSGHLKQLAARALPEELLEIHTTPARQSGSFGFYLYCGPTAGLKLYSPAVGQHQMFLEAPQLGADKGACRPLGLHRTPEPSTSNLTYSLNRLGRVGREDEGLQLGFILKDIEQCCLLLCSLNRRLLELVRGGIQVRPNPIVNHAYMTLPTGKQTEIRKMKEILHCMYS